jgi:hypothetical protein
MSDITKAPGSLAYMSKYQNIPLAEIFAGIKVLLLFDHSTSMEIKDASEGQSRYAAACDELRKLQAAYPGQVGLLAFADDCQFCPSGIPPRPDGCTSYLPALEWARRLDGTDVSLVLISDGEPDDGLAAIKLAAQFQTKIDVIYIGPPGREGERYMRRFSDASGGEIVNLGPENIHLLSDKVVKLLSPGS